MEAKLDTDIFSDFTINTAKGIPVTNGHPPIEDNGGLLNGANYKKYVKGSLGDNIAVRDGHIEGIETIFDKDLISELKSGKKLQVSTGLRSMVVYEPGEYQGNRYDARQTNIRMNHIAHVERGRAGDSVRAYLDSAIPGIAVMHTKYETRSDDMPDNANGSGTANNMNGDDMGGLINAIKKFLMTLIGASDQPDQGTPKDQPDQGTPKDQPDQGTPKNDELVRKLQAKLDAQQAVLDKMNDEGRKGEENARFDEKFALIETAKSLIPDFTHKGMGDRDIKLKIIEKVLPFKPDVKLDEIDDITIDARCDAAIDLAHERAMLFDGNGNENRIDACGIDKKRKKRLSMMKDEKD
jgi:hypothetical protein